MTKTSWAPQLTTGGCGRHPAISHNAGPSGPAIDAVVKWFNADKGFGFVELADRSGDAFLHAAVLEAAGHTKLIRALNSVCRSV